MLDDGDERTVEMRTRLGPGPVRQRASPAARTTVIVLAQLVVIVALLVVWSIVRRRRCQG